MLVFISDLHFADGSAGEHNIPHQAFQYFFEDLVTIVKKESNEIQEIQLIFLGDIFDLLRTEYWLDFPENHMPWGNDTLAVQRHAETIFDRIVNHAENQLTLQEICRGVETLRNAQDHLKQKTSVAYVPGNHDRLINEYPSLREQVIKFLGIIHDKNIPFKNFLEFPEYGVFARHGHEFDCYNYEGGPNFLPEDYRQAPIGDPITTSLVAMLPYELKRRLERHSTLPPEVIAQVVTNFKEIDNVRPFSAVIDFLLYQIRRDDFLERYIEETVDDVIKRFNNLEFVQQWYDRHDKWLDPFDAADKIQAVLFILEKFRILTEDFERILTYLKKLKDLFVKDELADAAPNEPVLLDHRFRYVVYGHTHEPMVMPMRRKKGKDQIYLNTGTWRTRHTQATRDGSFVSWKNMTFVIFYLENERKERKADFETWTGTLKYV